MEPGRNNISLSIGNVLYRLISAKGLFVDVQGTALILNNTR